MRRSTLTANGSTRQWRARRPQVFRLKGRWCHWCGAPATEIDHVVPRAEGGTDDLANLVPSCRSCNARRADEWVRRNRTHGRNPPPRQRRRGRPATGALAGVRTGRPSTGALARPLDEGREPSIY